MKKRVLAAVLAVIAVLTGCSAKTVTYNDGIYRGVSGVFKNEDGTENGNGFGAVDIEIKDGKISSCTYKTFSVNGAEKDEDYGKINGEISDRHNYNQAQLANESRAKYAEQLVYKGTIDEVDTISGATINYNLFVEAVQDALAKAEKK